MKKVKLTIIELLCAIFIVAVLCIMAISGISSFSDKNQEKDLFYDEEKLNQEIQQYLKAHPNIITAVGEVKEVSLREIQKDGFLTETISDEKGKSCLDTSKITIYYNSSKELKYVPYFSCDRNQVNPIGNEANIQITYEDAFSDWEDAKFMIYYYGDLEQEIAIDSYQYQIFSIKDKKTEEVYSSPWLQGEDLNEIIVEEEFSKYLDQTDSIDEINIKASMKNVAGRYFDTTVVISR